MSKNYVNKALIDESTLSYILWVTPTLCILILAKQTPNDTVLYFSRKNPYNDSQFLVT